MGRISEKCMFRIFQNRLFNINQKRREEKRERGEQKRREKEKEREQKRREQKRPWVTKSATF